MADEETLVIKYSKALNFASHFADGSIISTASKPGDMGMVQILFYETSIEGIQETATKNPSGSYTTSPAGLLAEHTRECRARLTMTQKTAKELQVALEKRLDLDEPND